MSLIEAEDLLLVIYDKVANDTSKHGNRLVYPDPKRPRHHEEEGSANAV